MNCLCTLYDNNFVPFIKMVIKSFEEFGKINNFDVICFDYLFNEKEHPSWQKLRAVDFCFKKGYEWVFWADADSLFVSKTRLPKYQSFTTQKDSNGICLSHFIIQNTEYNRTLLNTLLFLGDVKDSSKFGIGIKWEQNALKALMLHFDIPITTFHDGFICEPKYCKDPLQISNQTHFLHYAITSNEERKIQIEKHYNQFCQYE